MFSPQKRNRLRTMPQGLANATVILLPYVSVSDYYTLNVCNITCLFYLNKAGKNSMKSQINGREKSKTDPGICKT